MTGVAVAAVATGHWPGVARELWAETFLTEVAWRRKCVGQAVGGSLGSARQAPMSCHTPPARCQDICNNEHSLEMHYSSLTPYFVAQNFCVKEVLRF